jgi:NDP-sugar pyrophosphorylase family protein
MNAMVLAAGLGTRLGDIGRVEPKALIDIGGRPLLERHLEFLQRQGIGRVVINAHHLAPRIESFVRDYAGGLEIVCLVEEHLLGTAGAVRNALSHLEPAPFIVLYGDVLVDEPLAPLLELHEEREAVATIALYEADSAEGKGLVEVDANGRVTRFVEKSWSAAGPALINAGVYVMESALVASLAPGIAYDFGHDVFPAAVADGAPVYAGRLRSPVIDVGTPEGLAHARAAVQSSPPADGVGADHER